ncbi:MAG: hypothetical protein C5B48_01165 [Candidatus Rokuibacteriota bacterium]|nr:MAG: hypothetical protein C5B48_01165 [Candidatus Rokubacteria bacterium]
MCPPRPIDALLAGLAALLFAHASVQAGSPPLSLPSQIPAAERARLEDIMTRSFASTRVEHEPYIAQPDVWEYLLDHPEFATHVTRALKVARYRIWRDQTGLWLDDGWGVVGQFTVVHATPGRRIIYARGHFEQKFLPDIRGQAVGTIEYMFRPDGQGHNLVATAATGYVQVDNRVLNALGKVAAPMVQAKADREAGLLLRTFARVTRALEERPAQVYELVSERPDVPRGELEEFRRLLRLP